MLSVLRESVYTVCRIICCHACDVSFLPSHYSGRQLVGFMFATAATANAIAGNVEVD